MSRDDERRVNVAFPGTGDKTARDAPAQGSREEATSRRLTS